jgi:polyhydroxybutyrate depolymerase
VREYLLYVPDSYNGTQAVPFVLALHGLGDTIGNFKSINMNLVADTANFIFAIPQALVDPLSQSTAWNSGAGNFGVALSTNVDDVGFLNALIDSVSANYNIDQTRVYCTGFSMGGFMTNRLACELNNRIAAGASVSGTIGNEFTCNPARAISMAHFHGTADQVVAYTNNLYGNNAEALVAYWAQHDHCNSTPSSIDTLPKLVNDNRTIVHYVYPNGDYGTQVEFYKSIGGAHEWLVTGHDINYTVAVWQFFYRYRWLPQTSGIGNEVNEPALNIYPNPASGQFNISVPAGSNTEITITDMMGKSVYKTHTTVSEQTIQVNTGGLMPGLYIVNLNTDGRNSSSKLCILQ